MGLFKDFKDAITLYTPGGMQQVDLPTNYNIYAAVIGDTGTVADFIAATAGQRETVDEKSKAYYKMKIKTVNRSADAYTALSNAVSDLDYSKKEFVRGAMDGFEFDRVQNIQAILADPETFRPSHDEEEDTSLAQTFAAAKLAELLKRSSDPEKVPAIALAKATPHDKQLILNRALAKLSAEETPDEKTAAAITALKNANAGAPVADEHASPTIRSKKAPKKLILSPQQRFGK